MASVVNIEVNVNDAGVTTSLANQTQKWQESTSKWGAAVDNFKNNLVAYNAVADEGGRRLAAWDAAMEEAKAQGASFAEQLENASQSVVNFNAQLDQMGTKAEYNMTVARAAASGLERELGVGQGVGRALQTFVARSETLGPIFAAAFNVVAAVAFGEVIAQLTTKVVDLYNATSVWTDAMKAAFALQVSANTQIQQAVEKTKELEADYFSKTHTGVENASHDLDTLAQKHKQLEDQISSLTAKRTAALGVSGQTETRTSTISTPNGPMELSSVLPTAAAQQAQQDLQNIDRNLVTL